MKTSDIFLVLYESLQERALITNHTAWRPHRWSQERWCWRPGISWQRTWSTCWRRGKRVSLWSRRWWWRWEQGCRSGTWTVGEDKSDRREGEKMLSLCFMVWLDICIGLERMNCARVRRRLRVCAYHSLVFGGVRSHGNLVHWLVNRELAVFV